MKDIEVTINTAVKANLPCLLVGPHGTGKSYGIKMAAQKAEKKLHRIIITQETTPEDLVFQYELKDAETVLKKHALLEAAENGDWICLEEINMGSPAVLTLLNGLLETDPSSRFIKFQDIEVTPHEDFRLFATANPTEYSGTNQMNDALLSRFLVGKVNPDYQGFLEVIKDMYGPKETKMALQFFSGIQKIQENYEIYISPRELLVYTKLRHEGVKKADAIKVVLGRHYDLDQDIYEAIQAIMQVEADRNEEFVILNQVEIERMKDKIKEEVQQEIEKEKGSASEIEEKAKKYDVMMEALSKKIS